MSDAPLGRRLPLVSGANHLRFRCNGCADCCRSLRVAITHHDLSRLGLGLARPVSSFVDWLAPDEVDMTNEPGSFVELRGGRRLMVLAQRDGACHLLGSGQRCSAYAHRPLDCRLYPFDLSRDEAGTLVRLGRLDPDGCGDLAEPADMAEPAMAIAELDSSDERRWRELADYQSRVARWNQLARHRQRFRRRVGDADEFFAFLGLAPPIRGVVSGAGPSEGNAGYTRAAGLGTPKQETFSQSGQTTPSA
jgi:Fe-S-cluster containining protein